MWHLLGVAIGWHPSTFDRRETASRSHSSFISLQPSYKIH